jgi:hypothetical protein
MVEVNFQVDQKLLGEVGPVYTLREWAGLWAAGQERYAVGERVVVFLHVPGKSGLSSPVDGMDGIVPVMQESAQSEPLLDVRRLAVRVARPVGGAIVDAEDGAISLVEATSVVAAWREPVVHPPKPRPLPMGVATVLVSRAPQPVVLMASRVR